MGSGGNPFPRSNVLVDAYEDTQERHWEELVHDRPTVLAFGEKLPFKDKSFDFVIAAHVLEHVPDPDKFLSELQRVARAGYIETPDAFMERINPYRDHRLEVTQRNNQLLIRKKASPVIDQELVELYSERAKIRIAQKLIPKYPFDFHVQHYWSNKINYEILNPEVDATWQPISSSRTVNLSITYKQFTRQIILNGIRLLFSQKSRNNKIDLLSILVCQNCGVSDFIKYGNVIKCNHCQHTGSVRGNLYKLNPETTD